MRIHKSIFIVQGIKGTICLAQSKNYGAKLDKRVWKNLEELGFGK